MPRLPQPSRYAAAAAARSFFPAAFVSFVSLLSLCCSATAQTPATPVAAPPAPQRAEHVFIVSFDGGNPAVMKESRMPTLFGLLPRAASTFSAQTIFPSITLPSHTSMLTGVGPEKHRVLWNNWEPEKGLVTVPTIFALAKKQNLSTAMFVGKPKLLHLYVPKTVDEFSLPEYHARNVSEAAARYIVAKKPALCFIHFADPDGAGHAHGWGSNEQKRAFAASDVALKTILDAINRAGIAKTSVVLITADHGGHAKTHGSGTPDDMIIPWIAWGANVRPGYTIVAPVTTYDTAATALWLLNVPLPDNLDGKPVTSAFVR
jgi:predicted AlkP superfamily pyrophosphatase or phosphodiesterase